MPSGTDIWEQVASKAKIHNLSAYSACPTKRLINCPRLPQVTRRSGSREEDALSNLAQLLKDSLGVRVSIPVWGESKKLQLEALLHGGQGSLSGRKWQICSELSKLVGVATEREEEYAWEIQLAKLFEPCVYRQGAAAVNRILASAKP